jgi:hypothetical protein
MRSTVVAMAGQIWESRDEQYEPGRRIRLLPPDAGAGEANPFWRCETVANPVRPSRAGTITTIRQATLIRRWRLIDAGVAE